MKTFLRATALTLSLVFVMTGFAVPFAALRASAAETGEGLGASAACEGHTLGTFSGLPACVNKNGDLHICENNFPDVNFRSFLTPFYFVVGGHIDEEDSPTTLYVANRAVKSLRGIEFFTKLKSLDCYSNRLTELDMSKNTELTRLDCRSNQLTELDVTSCTALTELSCDSNQLTELDVSKNTDLTRLGCFFNQLTELDVTKNTDLTSLSCGSNQLTELDVTGNTALTSLSCFSNQLTELDVTGNTALTYLSCSSNQLTELDVSNNTALETLNCSSNQLTELDVNNNTALTGLGCYSNLLTELDVSNNTALTSLSCESNQLTELDVSNNTALTHLSCEFNQLTELDVSNNTALTHLSCESNRLTELDVSNNTALTYLFCYSNQLTELDVSKNTALRYFSWNSNQRDLELISKNGLWTADMSKLVSSSNFDRITSFSQGTFDSKTGLLTFAGKPSSFTYKYDVGYVKNDRTMTVTVNLTEHIHSFSDWQVRTPASCTEPGEEFRSCACGEEETRSIDPLGHSFTNYVYDNNAACTTDGTETAKCDRCDATDTRTAAGTATGHTFSDWQVRTPASCTESGEEFRSCACGEEETRSIDPLGHDFAGEWTTDTPASCTEPGSKSHHCTRCEAKADVTSIPPLGHSFTNYVYDNNAACTTDGTETAKCDRCDATDTRTAAGTATGHTFSGWQVRTPASCTEPGEEFRACACGEEETRSIDPLGHTLVKTEAVEPTETSAGNIEYWTCTVCGKLFSDEAANNEITQAETVLPKLEHTHVYGSYAYDGNAHWQTCACGQTSERTPHAFGAWTVTKEPTYTEEGSRSRTCVCGFTETETLPCAVLLGDVNLDGKVTPTDYLLLKRQLVVEDCLTEAGKQRADINGDGALTPTDYLLLKRMILGL